MTILIGLVGYGTPEAEAAVAKVAIATAATTALIFVFTLLSPVL
jgi:hypothetical protein